MIEINNVSMTFNTISQKTPFVQKALDSVSLTIPDGSIYGFLGSNGAGKSTLMRMIAGIYKTEFGSIKFDGTDIYDNPKAKSQIFFVNDETIQYTSFTLMELKNYYKNYYISTFNEQTFQTLVQRLGLPVLNKMSTFSKGMKRQAVVIIGLSCGTKYLMMDEAFDGLDPAMRTIVANMIREEVAKRQATLIISSHNVSEISLLCDHALLMHKGKLIFADAMQNIKSGCTKIQIACNNRLIMPQEILSTGITPLNMNAIGSIVQIIAKGEKEQLINMLRPLNPDILEAVPMTLDEIFIFELEARGYGTDILDKN